MQDVDKQMQPLCILILCMFPIRDRDGRVAQLRFCLSSSEIFTGLMSQS